MISKSDKKEIELGGRSHSITINTIVKYVFCSGVTTSFSVLSSKCDSVVISISIEKGENRGKKMSH